MKFKFTKDILTGLCKRSGYTSITDFAVKTGRQPATVFGHVKHGSNNVDSIRRYAGDLGITFIEALNIFTEKIESDILNVAEHLGFEVCNEGTAKYNNYLLCKDVYLGTFTLYEFDPETAESKEVLKINFDIQDKEVLEYLLKKAICN